MNAISADEEWLFLCPENVKKLQHFHEESRYASPRYLAVKDNFVRDYHNTLLSVLKKDRSMARHCVWLRRLVAADT